MQHITNSLVERRSCSLIAISTALIVLALVPLAASAAETRQAEPFSPITGFTAPNGISVDEASGNVFVNNSTSAVRIVGGEGGSPAGLVPPFELTGLCFATANGNAYDNSASSPSKGTLYVPNCGGKVKKFTRNPLTEKYELAGECTATGATFDSSVGATVDTHGNLFVGDFFSGSVVKFNPACVQVARYTFVSPTSVAVSAAGDLFVAAAAGGPVVKCPASGLPADGTEGAPTGCVQVVASAAGGVAVDPVRNNLFIPLQGPGRVAQYDATTLAEEFVFGAGVLGLNGRTRVAVNSATDRVYVADSAAGRNNVAVFGAPVPISHATTGEASDITGTTATLNGTVNPRGFAVTGCKFEYGLTEAYGASAPCTESLPTDEIDHPVSAPISGLTPNGTAYHFRLVIDTVNGKVTGADTTFITGRTARTDPATGVSDTTATLNGAVRPEGQSLTGCEFEYGTALDYGQTEPCDPSAGSISADFAEHSVTGPLTGLEPNTTYHFRLRTSSVAYGTVFGEDLTFTTSGPPQILEQTPVDVGQTTAVLQARIDPSGAATTYHFEWGLDTSYGNRLPLDHDPSLASSEQPERVQAGLSGLQPATVYHFRVVATSPEGTSVGPDQPFETLGVNGLPEGRGFELVTPADKGPAGSIADSFSRVQWIQASVNGESFVYPLQNGLDSSTSGGWLRQRATRTSSGWLSAQIYGPALIPAPRNEFGISQPGKLRFVSPDTSCALIESYNPLTEDTSQASVELGVENLYRWSAEDGDYDLITNRLPLNPDLNPPGGFYSQVEASDDCSRVYFRSLYDLISGASGLYEWDEGTLRDAGVLPNGGVGGTLGSAGRAAPGGQVDSGTATARWNAVSPDGSRFFFTAIANEGPSAGTPAVFMRTDGGAEVVEISRSETGVPTNGARFETASPDGSRVIFRANYGIDSDAIGGTSTTACGPRSGETDHETFAQIEKKACDLYAYDVETGEVTDLSADSSVQGAQVQGAVAVDEDGSHVYFAALGQLVPGEGRSYIENTQGSGSANVYLYRDDVDPEGQLTYVTTLAHQGSTGDLFGVRGREEGAALMRRANTWIANTSADGNELLFMSSLDLTGYDPGGIDNYAAYVFSAATDRLSCVSCRPDGLPSIATGGSSPTSGEFHQSAWLVAGPEEGGYRPRSMSDDGALVVFTTPDPLATGAVAGKRNVYQWRDGQVTLLAVAEPGGVNGLRGYQDMSADGRDVFIASGDQLVPQDTDFLSDIYDVRVGGGFAPPTVPPPPCQVDQSIQLAVNQVYCHGEGSSQPVAPSPPSAAFRGPGNPPATKPRRKACPKGKVRRRGKCRKRAKRRAAHRRSRAASSNRGGVK